jgi:hypothetical protein
MEAGRGEAGSDSSKRTGSRVMSGFEQEFAIADVDKEPIAQPR